jgi:hypothetical protein
VENVRNLLSFRHYYPWISEHFVELSLDPNSPSDDRENRQNNFCIKHLIESLDANTHSCGGPGGVVRGSADGRFSTEAAESETNFFDVLSCSC